MPKNVHSLKSKPLSCPHFVKKSFHSLKNTVPSCHFFQKVFMINMPLSCPCSVKKRQFCQKYNILWAPRVNRMQFFPIFLEKITALMPIFRQKNYHSLKITLPSCPNFVKKTSIFSKKLCYDVIFSNLSQKFPCPHARI